MSTFKCLPSFSQGPHPPVGAVRNLTFCAGTCAGEGILEQAAAQRECR